MDKELLYQLFDAATSTYSYLLIDQQSRDAIMIDPVLDKFERDLKLITQLKVQLRHVLETHVHADHCSGAKRLAQATGARIGLSVKAEVQGKYQPLSDGDIIRLGHSEILVLETPGHTNACLSFVSENKVFTGDTLFIRGCGRTDFQNGSSELLYESITKKLYTLPGKTFVYPGHDYNGLCRSSIDEEKAYNLRLPEGRSLSEFTQIMSNLNLPYPKRMDESVSFNRSLGWALSEENYE